MGAELLVVVRPLPGDPGIAFLRSCCPRPGGWAQPSQMDEKNKKGGHPLEAAGKLPLGGGPRQDPASPPQKDPGEGALTVSFLYPRAPQFPSLGPGCCQRLFIQLWDAPEATVSQLCCDGVGSSRRAQETSQAGGGDRSQLT